MPKRLAATVLLSMLAACGGPRPRPTAPPAAPPPAAPGAPYRIDAAQSELRLLVYRSGPMAALGHNHVIVNRALEGSVEYAGRADGGSFALRIPAAGFVVDEAEARQAEGPEFAAEVPADAKAGTLRNMLGPQLLDAAQFPAITVQSSAVAGAADALEATVVVTVAGHRSTLTVPFKLEAAAGRLIASGAFTVRQSALGLAPFSVLLGALRVQDEIGVKFRLVATAN